MLPSQFGAYPNVHISAKDAKLVPVGNGVKAYLRSTFSDRARLHEFKTRIYTEESYLFDKAVKYQPDSIVDVGANIGLSTLALLQSFPSVKFVVGVEADKLNYEMLKLNYSLFATTFPQIRFLPINAIASSCNRAEFKQTKLAGGVSASGIIRFIPREANSKVSTSLDNTPMNNHINVMNMQDILTLAEVDSTSALAVKIDIEGGEEYLFEDSCTWLSDTVYMTAEIHDRFSEETSLSSRNLLAKLAEYDFAICPSKDVLSCYNRSLLSLGG
jgi:FkbM family methyltransferase